MARMRKRRDTLGIAAVMTVMAASPAFADLSHENDLLVGDRALGFGGAYTALADDASGLYYNPGGIAFAKTMGGSASMTGYFDKKINYRHALVNQDYTRRANGLIPGFLGGLRSLTVAGVPLVGGFAIYSTTDEITRQNQEFGAVPAINLRRALTHNVQENTLNYVTVGGGMRQDTLGVGVTLSLIQARTFVQHLSKVTLGPYALKNSPNTYTTIMSTDARVDLQALILEAGMGMRWQPSTEWSLGAAVRWGAPIHDEGQYQSEAMSLSVRDGNGVAVNKDEVVDPRQFELGNESQSGGVKFLERWPLRARMGVAWAMTPSFLWAMDAQWTQGAGKGGINGSRRRPVVNAATGIETTITKDLAVNAGFFTNRDASPEVSSTSGNNEHMDYQGYSLLTRYRYGEMTVSLGAIYQQAEGTARIVNLRDYAPISAIRGQTLQYTVGIGGQY